MILNVNIIPVISVAATAVISAITARIINTNHNCCNSGFCYLILLILLVVTQAAESESLATQNVLQLDVDGKLNADTSRITNLTRQHNGDVFTANGKFRIDTNIFIFIILFFYLD